MHHHMPCANSLHQSQNIHTDIQVFYAGNSHRAYDDALSAMKLYEKLHQIKPDDTGFDELIELNYSAKKDSPITAAQRKYLIALTEKHGLEPVEDIDALTKSRASKLIDNIISNYGK